jgi:DNA-binding CsgD family transcriptional regulator
MEHRGNEERRQGSTTARDRRSWVNWQSALYAFVLGAACVFLVPLTSLWWIVPVLGAVVPIALAVLDGSALAPEGSRAGAAKERKLLHALAERGELTPATAAMRTSLTVDEASKMLDGLAREGHLTSRTEDGLVSYVPRGRDRHETPGGASAPSGGEPERDGTPLSLGATRRLEDPLSERELEVLSLLASGKTSSEVAGDLFISVGTVKSHTGNIYRKLDARNRAQALTRARDLELLR